MGTDESPAGDRPGIELLLTTQVARRPDINVNERTVLRWVKNGLPATLATTEQIADLVRGGYLSSIPPRGIYLIRESDLDLIPRFRAPAERMKRTGKGN